MTTGEVEEGLLAIPPKFGRVVVDVRAIPEGRSLLPLALTKPQSAGGIAQFRRAFQDRGEPHGEQIAIGTFRDRRAVIVPGKERAG